MRAFSANSTVWHVLLHPSSKVANSLSVVFRFTVGEPGWFIFQLKPTDFGIDEQDEVEHERWIMGTMMKQLRASSQCYGRLEHH